MELVRLATDIRGQVLDASSTGFDRSRMLWSMRADRRPDVIVRPLGEADVRAAVRFAREEDLLLSVKNGGHSYGMNSVLDGGLLVDLSLMTGCEVDVEARTVTVRGGVTCGELDEATWERGLATPIPITPSVGVAGASLGGGIALSSRKLGLSADNLISARVVINDGSVVEVSADENPDLFWALRGGGGNFGIATSLTLRLHQIQSQILTGLIVYPLDNARDLLRAYREFMAYAPRELYCGPLFSRIPPRDPFPAEEHGQVALSFQILHMNPDAVDDIAPLRNLAEPILDLVETVPYLDLQRRAATVLPEEGQRYYSKAHDFDDLNDGAIDVVVEQARDMKGEFTSIYFYPTGGAISDVAENATAFGSRGAAYGFHCIAGWSDAADDEEVMSWASQIQVEMASHSTGGVYVLQIADDEDQRIPDAYGTNYPRLQELKANWDPENVFQSNYNIVPL